jgi:hypothetical protein
VTEPVGEPRIADKRAPSMTHRTGLGVTEIDVPEFLPRR